MVSDDTSGHRPALGPPEAHTSGQSRVPGGPMVHLHACSRLGLQANPPSVRWSLGGWLRRR